MKLHHILEAKHHKPIAGPVKLWRFKAEGPGRGHGIETGHYENTYVLWVDRYTDEYCSKCDGDGVDDYDDECEDCGGDGENHWDDFGDQWETGEVIGEELDVEYATNGELELKMEGKDLLEFIQGEEINIPDQLLAGIYR